MAAASQQRWRYDSDAERQFSAALRSYSRGDFDFAVRALEHLIGLPLHQKTTAAYVMLGKTYFNLGNYRESVRLLKRFIDGYHESSYTFDAQYTVGLDYFMLRRYDDALLHALTALDVKQDPKLQSQAASLCERIAERRVTLPELEEVWNEVRSSVGRDLLAIKIAERHLASGNVVLAQKWAEPVALQQPAGHYTTRATDMLARIKRGIGLKVGALLPLTVETARGVRKGDGEEFLAGIQMAVDEANADGGLPIRIALEVRDTRHNKIIARERLLELSNDTNIVAVLGPVYSDEAFACADLANLRGIPLVSPTANADGIARTGRFVFQTNPDLSMRGRVAARYGLDVLGLKVWAILGPSEGFGRTMGESFAGEIERGGGHIAAAEWYSPDATDLREEFQRIRRASIIESTEPEVSFARKFTPREIMRLVEAGIRPKLIDSLMEQGASVGVTKLFGPNGRKIADSLRLKTTVREPKADSLETTVSGIQGIFLPITSTDRIGILTSQLAYYGISAQPLGAGEWYDAVELDANRRYANGVIFVADSYLSEEDTTYMRFVQRYLERYKKKPTANVLYGYDAAKVVLDQILKGAVMPVQIADELSNVTGYPGIHSRITLVDNGVNSELHVLQYKDGQIRRIAQFSSP